MKKIFALLMASFMLVSITSCGKPADNKDDEKKEHAISEVEEKDETTEKEDAEKNEEIVLDIKKLEQVDEVTLDEAANALGFENEKFFHAVANAIGKEPFEMTMEDIENVHYVAVGPEGELGHTVYIGYVDYVDACFSEGEDIMQKLNDVVMVSEFSYDKNTDTLSDLGNFKNVEMFEIYDVAIDDISFIKEYETLIFGYFKNNGITDVSCLADYNPETLVELDLTGNDIADWTPLYPIKEKVTVFYGESDGMPVILTLEDMLNQKNGEQSGEEQNDEQQKESEPEETTPEEVPVFVDENGEQVDFSSLFD